MGRWIVSLLFRVRSLLIWRSRVSELDNWEFWFQWTDGGEWLTGGMVREWWLIAGFGSFIFLLGWTALVILIDVFVSQDPQVHEQIKAKALTLLQPKQNKPIDTLRKTQKQHVGNTTRGGRTSSLVLNKAITHGGVVTLLQGLCLVYAADLRHEAMGNRP